MQAGSGRTQGIDALDIRHYLRVVWKRKWLIVAVVAATTGAAWILQSRQVPIFQAATTVLIEPEPPRVVNFAADVNPGTGNTQEYYATQQRIITSRPVVGATIQRLDLKTRIPALRGSSDPVGSFVRRTTVDAVRNTRLINVRFESPDPQIAADVANGLAAEYVRYIVDQKHRTAKEALAWLNEQIGELRGKTKVSTAALQAFQARADLLGLQEQRQLTQAKIIDINRTYQEAQNQRLTMESRLKELTDVAKDPNAAESILRVADDPLIRKPQAEASDLCRGGGAAAGGRGWECREQRFRHLGLYTAYALDVFAREGLTVVDVDELTTHGGFLRVYARHRDDDSERPSARVGELLARETAAGLRRLERYHEFAEQVRETKRALLDFLIATTRKGQTIVGYGAPAKGNTLLNYCGVRTDLIAYTVDRSPHKQGMFLPGTRIPIHAPERIAETRPDYLLILPWNLKDEIMEQMAGIREWGGRFVVPVPRVEVYA
jgi:capsular polysaccharide biosynthesis protein